MRSGQRLSPTDLLIDAYTDSPPCGREAKNGLQRSRRLLVQIAKDRELMAGALEGCVEWHFYPSGRSKTLGMSYEILAALRDGQPPIRYVVHFP